MFGTLFKMECPFCRQVVDPKAKDFRWVTIVTEEGWHGRKDAPRQDFGCHHECLDRLLGPHLPIL
jgi:hypothetical protein